MKLFSKNSNLCDHNPPTSQMDKQTDDMRCDETPHQIHRTQQSSNNAVTGHDSV